MRLAIAGVAPGSKDLFLPCVGRGDVGGGLGARDEDEVEAALEVVCLEGAADRGGDLERRLTEGDRGKGDAGRGDEADGLGGGYLVPQGEGRCDREAIPERGQRWTTPFLRPRGPWRRHRASIAWWRGGLDRSEASWRSGSFSEAVVRGTGA